MFDLLVLSKTSHNQYEIIALVIDTKLIDLENII